MVSLVVDVGLLLRWRHWILTRQLGCHGLAIDAWRNTWKICCLTASWLNIMTRMGL
jgi:hypothetical protein